MNACGRPTTVFQADPAATYASISRKFLEKASILAGKRRGIDFRISAVYNANVRPYYRRIAMKHFFCVAFILFSVVGFLQAEEPRFIELKGHTGEEVSALMYDSVDYIVFSPDGKKIVTSGDDKTTRIWDAETGKELKRLDGHSTKMAFSPDGKKLFVSNRIHDVESGKELQRFEQFRTAVSSDRRTVEKSIYALSSDGKKIVYYDRNNRRLTCIFDLESGRELQTIEPIGWYMCFSPDGTKIAIWGFIDDTQKIRSVQIRDTESGKELRRLKCDVGEIRSIVFSPDGKKIVLAGGNLGAYGTIQILDVDSGMELLKWVSKSRCIIYSAAFSPDGKTIAVGDWLVRLFDIETGKELQYLCLEETSFTHLHSIAFSPDGKKLAVAGDECFAGVWVLEE